MYESGLKLIYLQPENAANKVWLLHKSKNANFEYFGFTIIKDCIH